MIDLRTQNEDQPKYATVPEGEYLMHIDSAADKQAKGGKQSFQLEILATLSYRNERVPVRLYIAHTQADGQTGIPWGRKRVADLFTACGISLGDFVDESLLNGKLCIVKLKYSPPEGKYGPKNDLVESRSARRGDGGYENPQAVPVAAESAGLPADYGANGSAAATSPADMEGNPMTQPVTPANVGDVVAAGMQPSGGKPF